MQIKSNKDNLYSGLWARKYNNKMYRPDVYCSIFPFDSSLCGISYCTIHFFPVSILLINDLLIVNINNTEEHVSLVHLLLIFPMALASFLSFYQSALSVSLAFPYFYPLSKPAVWNCCILIHI